MHHSIKFSTFALPRPKEVNLFKSNLKPRCFFFDIGGIIMFEYVPSDHIIGEVFSILFFFNCGKCFKTNNGLVERHLAYGVAFVFWIWRPTFAPNDFHPKVIDWKGNARWSNMLHTYHIFLHASFVFQKCEIVLKGTYFESIEDSHKGQQSHLNNVSAFLFMVSKNPVSTALHVIRRLDPRFKTNWNNDVHWAACRHVIGEGRRNNVQIMVIFIFIR
jgi:hypothetical protein